MKTTKIKVRAYNDEFEVEIQSKEHYTIQQADEYVKKKIIETGQVIHIIQILEDGELTIKNDNYKDPNGFELQSKGIALKYLNKNEDDKED